MNGSEGSQGAVADDFHFIILSHLEIIASGCIADLIRALGEDFILYDERRLEKLISRLRTKLLLNFKASPIKAIRGKGYTFKETIVSSLKL